MVDVTDATFETAVLARSDEVPVVVDLWAPWCGPCRTLGPIIEKVVAATGGKVELAKIDIDENPRVAQAFQVQSIPMVVAIRDRQVVDHFMGALPEREVQAFIDRLLPTSEEEKVAALVEAGDEASLMMALELDPDNAAAITKLAELRVRAGEPDEALALLEKIPETPETRHVAALARAGDEASSPEEIERRLVELLGAVKGDDDARQEFLDLLELLGPSDPRTAEYRKKLTAHLF